MSNDSTDLPEPYRSIRSVPLDEQGWFLNGPYIQEFIKINPTKTIIEVGSWLGLSTRFMARLLPKDGKIYAIDTWLGSNEDQKDPRMHQLYQIFLSNVKHAELTHKIVPIRMTSQEAAKALNIQADLIYIDGSHEEEDVYNDILAWHSHLKEGGTLCGNEFILPSVFNAVKKASLTLKKNIKYIDLFWTLE